MRIFSGTAFRSLSSSSTRFFPKLGEISHGFVQIRHVCRMVLVVVNLHGEGVNVRLQRVKRIRQGWKRERACHSGRRCRPGGGLSAGCAQNCGRGASGRRQSGCFQCLPASHHNRSPFMSWLPGKMAGAFPARAFVTIRTIAASTQVERSQCPAHRPAKGVHLPRCYGPTASLLPISPHVAHEPHEER